MTARAPAPPTTAIRSAPDFCGRLAQPGRGIDNRAELDYADKPTTADQAQIEQVLAQAGLAGRSILHVGVGNSSLARRLAPAARLVDGVTLDPDELAAAAALALPNYRVYRFNKHGKEMLRLPHRYDWIVDNNLASFACCKYHFYLMLDNYVTRLRPGGRIVTAQRGMAWTVDGCDAWRLTYADLEALGRQLALRTEKLTASVYALRKEEKKRRA